MFGEEYDPVFAERYRMWTLRYLCEDLAARQPMWSAVGGVEETMCQLFDDIDIVGERRPWLYLNQQQKEQVEVLSSSLNQLSDIFDDLNLRNKEMVQHPLFDRVRRAANSLVLSLPEDRPVERTATEKNDG